MATLRERLRARREAERRRLRSFTIGVSEDDLRVMAKHDYEGALSTDHEQQAQAVCRFFTQAVATHSVRPHPSVGYRCPCIAVPQGGDSLSGFSAPIAG